MPEVTQLVSVVNAVASLDLVQATNDVERAWLAKETTWLNDDANKDAVGQVMKMRATVRGLKGVTLGWS